MIPNYAGVWDGKQIRSYIDGKEMGASDYSPAQLNDSGASLYIGVGDSKAWTCQGLMDEIRIWEVARTEKEINEFMMNTLNGDETGLVAHYTFDEGNSKDNTKNKNDGKDAFGKSKYVDVSKEFDLKPLSVSSKGKLTTMWSKIKQVR